MITVRKGRSFQIVAFMPYRFYMDESGVVVRNERGRKIGTFATEKEAIEYLKEHRKALGLEV